MPEPAENSADHLADRLVANGTITSPAVAAAFRAVPRHLFVPEVTGEVAYEPHDAVVTKRDAQGGALSSMSSASIQAAMLEQAGIEPGMRVLEIGSGGYNAALIAHLVGPTGTVVTMDIDAEVIERARRFLPEADAAQVLVVLGDGEGGCPDTAPFDRIVVTVRAWDIPPAWSAQLTPDGVLVVPLELRGLTRSLALRRDGPVLVADSAILCGFVPMQGAGAHAEQTIRLPDLGLTVRHEGTTTPPGRVAAFLETARAEVWTGLALSRRDLAALDLQLWLAAELDGFATITVDTRRNRGLITCGTPFGAPAAITPDALGYVGVRQAGDGIEYGGHAYGPGATAAATTIATQIHAWHDQHAAGRRPVITVHPAGTAGEPPARGGIIAKQHSDVRVDWRLLTP